jgi:membrane protein implicated in regulation of membrane protease activity
VTWTDFYLLCFLVGFGMSLLSLLAGTLHVHLPHLHIHHGIHLGGHGHAGHGGGGHGHHTTVSFFNMATLSAFLTWFGGTGYLLAGRYGVFFAAALGIATLSGLGGAAVVFWFLAKVLISREEALDPADYEMVGVLGKLSIAIRPGGTGELIYTQGGTRRVTGARAEGDAAIAKGAEVVVTRYEKGIAYVRPWDELIERS